MPHSPSNIVLVGMPGCGKSTVGVILAKLASLDFVDTDLLIQRATDRLLQEIVNHEGYMALRAIEEDILLKLNCQHRVIATGGSAVYSRAAMDHLKKDGIIVFIDVDIATLKSRISNYETRGLAKRPDQSFEELFAERMNLYRKYADITVNGDRLSQEEVCEAILKWIDLKR
ncbi:MAG TPA: shikimate kinase [Dissulfurispiraceae bacterium]|nr:shikimate kinase [Dissulfurispiraceae bacterium]